MTLRPLRTLLLSLALVTVGSLANSQGCGVTPYGVGLGGANTGTLSTPVTPAPGAVFVFEIFRTQRKILRLLAEERGVEENREQGNGLSNA